MRTAKKLIGLVILTGMLVAGNAFAGSNCPSASVTKTGVYPFIPATVTYAVYATCDDTNVWSGEKLFFVAKDEYADKFYAAALTSVSSGAKVDMIVTQPDDYGVVKMLSVKNN